MWRGCMQRNWTAVLLVVLLLLSAVPAPLRSGEVGGGRCTEIVFLAVESEGKGTAMKVEVCVEGEAAEPIISIESAYSVDPSVTASFKLALIASELLAGVDTHKRITVRFGENSKSVRGPSAGLAFALAFLNSSGRISLNGRVAATGLLNIDGFVDPVAGVELKLEAAEKAGVVRTYIPLLNLPEVLTGVKNEVVPVASLTLLLNMRGSWEYDEELLRKVMEVMGGVATWLLRNGSSFIPPSRADEVLSMLRRGDNYTAASLAFRAYIEGLAQHLAENPELAGRLREDAKKMLLNITSSMERIESLGLAAVPAYIAAVERVETALELLDSVSRELNPNTTALLYARIATLPGWLSTIQLLNVSAPYVSRSLVDEKLRVYTQLVAECLGLENTTLANVVGIIEGSRSVYTARLGVIPRERDKVLRALEHLLAVWSSKLGPEASTLLRAMNMYAEYLKKLGEIESYVSIMTSLNIYAALTLFAVRGSVPLSLIHI